MENKKKFSTIIFDFDGTLADSFEIVVEILKDAAHKFGIKDVDDDDIERLRNSHWRDIVDELEIGIAKVPFIMKFALDQMGKRAEDIEPFDEIPNLIKDLKKEDYNLGILSTNRKKTINTFLKTHNLSEYFDFVYAEKTLFGKHKTMNKLIKKEKLKKDRTLYIGDEIRDIEAAQKSGVKIASVTWGYNSVDGLKEHNPDYLITSSKDLLKLLQP